MYGLPCRSPLFNSLTLFSDAENPRFVYEWRQEQERTLRATKGTGMTEEEVNHFVDGCTYPEVAPSRTVLTGVLQTIHHMSSSLKLSVRALSNLVCTTRRHQHLRTSGRVDSFALWSIVIGEYKKLSRFDVEAGLYVIKITTRYIEQSEATKRGIQCMASRGRHDSFCRMWTQILCFGIE